MLKPFPEATRVGQPKEGPVELLGPAQFAREALPAADDVGFPGL
jgi:hypothetical protein